MSRISYTGPRSCKPSRARPGPALVDLADRNSAHRADLLGEAVGMLIPLTAAGLREDYQRSALLHGCYLAQAHLAARDLEAAVGAIREAFLDGYGPLTVLDEQVIEHCSHLDALTAAVRAAGRSLPVAAPEITTLPSAPPR